MLGDALPIYTWLAALCAGLGATCLSLLVSDLLERVDVDKNGGMEEVKTLPFIFRIFMPLVPNIMPVAKSDTLAGMRAKSHEMINMSGFDQALSAEQFIAIRILMAGLGAIIMILMLFTNSSMSSQISALLIFLVCVVYPTTWLRGIVRRRHLDILKSLPNVLDLLTLSVEAGKDFLTALRDITGRRKMDALNEELVRTLQEIQIGKPRQRALKEMADRVQQPELSSVVNAIVQADELGVSIGQLLRIQGDQLRGKRFARAEKLANEAPVKILFPVIIFIFPSVFIILMAPILMQAMKTLVH